jgi:hypothetical protein
MERDVFPADVPSLLVDNLDRYPPEPEHEEDQTREYGSEEAFHDSYGWYSLIRRREPGSLRSALDDKLTDKTTRQSLAGNTGGRPPPPRVPSPHR